jgi:hypothetical protein
MIGDKLDARLDEERARLDAFGDEVRRFFDQLSQEIEADFARLMDRLSEQRQAMGTEAEALFASSAREGLQQRWQDSLPGLTARAGTDSVLGQALQGVLAGGARRGNWRPRNVISRLAGVFGTQLGRDIVTGLGWDEGNLRLSRAQQAIEQERQLGRATRDR